MKGSKAFAAEALEPLRQRVMGAVAVRFDSAMIFPHAKAPRYDAYREYMSGLAFFYKDNAQAELRFRRAIESDPEYFWPQLCLYHTYEGRQNEKAEAVLQTLVAKHERYAPIERIWIDVLKADLAGKWADAVSHLRRAEQLEPNHPAIVINLGMFSLMINRPADLLEPFEKTDFEPWHKYAFGIAHFWWLSDAHHLLGNYSASLAEVQRGRKHYPNDPGLRLREVSALIALGKLDELTRVVEDSLSQPTDDRFTPGGVMLMSAAELGVHGYREAALSMAHRAVAWVRARPPDAAGSPQTRMALGRALFLAEQWDEAHAVFADLTTKDGNDDVYAVGYLGVIAARKGDRAAVLAYAERLRKLTRRFLFGEHTFWRAAIAAHLGDKDEAVTLLRESFAQGQSYGLWLHRDATLEPLRRYPPFEELVRPKG